MTEKKNAAFKKALTEAVLSRHQSTLEADQEPVEFSETYRESVARLTRKTQRKTWKYVNTAAKRILIAAIVIMLLTMTAFAAIPALREGLIRFFLHDDGVAYSFEFTEEDYERAPREIETYYAPSWVPPQYSLISEKYHSTLGERIYINEAGIPFGYSQNILWQDGEALDYPVGVGSVMTVNSENTIVETQIIQGYEVKILRRQEEGYPEDVIVIWTDHNYFYTINSVNLSDEDIDHIIASMSSVAVP